MEENVPSRFLFFLLYTKITWRQIEPLPLPLDPFLCVIHIFIVAITLSNRPLYIHILYPHIHTPQLTVTAEEVNKVMSSSIEFLMFSLVIVFLIGYKPLYHIRCIAMYKCKSSLSSTTILWLTYCGEDKEDSCFTPKVGCSIVHLYKCIMYVQISV